MQAKESEFAQVIEWAPGWETGAPTQVFSNGRKVFLIYFINEHDPNWDGTCMTMIDNTSETTYPLALVEFSGSTFRFGIANDEVFHGLPLWDEGLEFYQAHIIENSTWISELKAIHKAHPQYREEGWQGVQHFVLLFHDEIFEVIATGYQVETFRTTFGLLAAEVARRMNQ